MNGRTVVKKWNFLVMLDETDAAMMRALVEHLDVPASDVVRWALRYWVCKGPWLPAEVKERRRILELTEELIVAPGVREVLK